MGKKVLVHVVSVRTRPGCIEYDLPPLEQAQEYDDDDLPTYASQKRGKLLRPGQALLVDGVPRLIIPTVDQASALAVAIHSASEPVPTQPDAVASALQQPVAANSIALRELEQARRDLLAQQRASTEQAFEANQRLIAMVQNVTAQLSRQIAEVPALEFKNRDARDQVARCSMMREFDEQQSRLQASGAQPMTTGFLQSLVTQVALTLFASTQQERS